MCMLIAADKYTSVTYLREHLQQVHEHKSQIGIAKICTTQGFESFLEPYLSSIDLNSDSVEQIHIMMGF